MSKKTEAEQLIYPVNLGQLLISFFIILASLFKQVGNPNELVAMPLVNTSKLIIRKIPPPAAAVSQIVRREFYI